jgi:hypothetical protein
MKRAFTEQQWFDKAERLGARKERFAPILRHLEQQIEDATDIQALQKIIERAEFLERRLERLQLLMDRHWEQRPLPLRVLAPP